MINTILIILYNLVDGITINLVGQLKLSEVLILATLPFLYRSYEFSRYPYLKKIIFCFVGILFFQIVTDLIVVHNVPGNFLRGWSQTIIAVASFLFFFKVLNGYKTIALFILLSAFRIYFSDPIDNIEPGEMAYFKFKVFPALNYLIYFIAIYMHRLEKGKLIPVLFILYGLTAISLDTRSLGVIFIISALILFTFYSGITFTRSRVILFSIVFIIIFQSLYVFYVNASLNGELGGEHSVEQLERLKNPYNPFSLLQTGRGETFAAIEAIKDAPLFGHGSWARDVTLKYFFIIQKFHAEDVVDDVPIQGIQLIPSHSILMGAWVNFGLGAFICVCFILGYILRMGFWLIKKGQTSPLYPIFIPIVIGFIWTFMFSPFQHLRYSVPYIADIIMVSFYLSPGNATGKQESLPDKQAELTNIYS